MNFSLNDFPWINACLNGTAALLLIRGYIFIKQHKMKQHALCMFSAFIVSIIFLVSYLNYHYYHGATRYPHVGFIRYIYYSILISHTTLAVVQVPLIFIVLYRAYKRQFQKHKRIARVTLPIWIYTSITGVV